MIEPRQKKILCAYKYSRKNLNKFSFLLCDFCLLNFWQMLDGTFSEGCIAAFKKNAFEIKKNALCKKNDLLQVSGIANDLHTEIKKYRPT